MDDSAQLSLEYLVIVALGIGLAAVMLLLAANIFSIKEGIKETINNVKNTMMV